MNIKYEGSKALLEGNVFEDEIVALRSYINEKKGEKITFDLTSCNDMHTAVIQLLLSSKALFDCEFIFSERKKPFAMAIDGFRVDHR